MKEIRLDMSALLTEGRIVNLYSISYGRPRLVCQLSGDRDKGNNIRYNSTIGLKEVPSTYTQFPLDSHNH